MCVCKGGVYVCVKEEGVCVHFGKHGEYRCTV